MLPPRTILVVLLATVGFGCGSERIDPRTLIPADALIYLETRDLGRSIAAITESGVYQQAAKTKPDLSAIEGMPVSIAVTGFQTSETHVTVENSVLNFQPRFVAVAETGMWSFQVNRFVEEDLGLFISETYGGEATLQASQRDDGRYFEWTAEDGRKAYAMVIGSAVLFGNDETAIERALAVRRSESPGIAGDARLPQEELLGFGFVSPEGIGQLANITGIVLAKRSSEEGEAQSFIARVLPELLRNSLNGLTWSAKQNSGFIEDNYKIDLDQTVSDVFNETLVPAGGGPSDLPAVVPADALSITRYDLRDPQVAWRSVLLTAQQLTDAASGSVIAAFAGTLFEPYGIDDGEAFLAAVEKNVYTVRFDAEGERAAVVARVKDIDTVRRSLAREIDLTKPAEDVNGAQLWRSAEDDAAAAFVDGFVVAGDRESVLRCLRSRGIQNIQQPPLLDEFRQSSAAAVTLAADNDAPAKVASVISERKDANSPTSQAYLTETRFNRNGIERRSVSELGLLGTIVAQFATAED